MLISKIGVPLLLIFNGMLPQAWGQEASQKFRQSQAQEREALEGQYGSQATTLGESYSQAYQAYLRKKGPYPKAELKKIQDLKLERRKARSELEKRQEEERADFRDQLRAKGSGAKTGVSSKGSDAPAPSPTPSSDSSGGISASSFPKVIEFKKKNPDTKKP